MQRVVFDFSFAIIAGGFSSELKSHSKICICAVARLYHILEIIRLFVFLLALVLQQDFWPSSSALTKAYF